MLAFSALVLVAAGFAGASCRSSTAAHVEVDGQQCATCHRSEYLMALNPPHEGAFPMSCGDCHSVDVWRPSIGFEHADDFELTGAHADATCMSCHTQGYEDDATPSECVGCHRDDYDGSTFTGHDSFPTTCVDCHGTDAWKPASLPDHDRFFVLEGAHREASCASCHTNGYGAGDTPSTCVGCHQSDYDGSPFPSHGTFATTCQDCHTTTAWMPATIPDHPFPLEGAHATASCASCHTVGYGPGDTPTTCVSCHRSDYDGSPYPGHSSFPTTCQECHTTTAWTPATGGAHPEAAFPITSGNHSEVECMQCHSSALGPNGKDNTDCVSCHEHTRAEMDAKHIDDHQIEGYPSGSAPANFCLDCHEDGSN